MKAKPAPERPKFWRFEDIDQFKLIYGTATSYSTTRHFHEELEVTITQGNAREFYVRGTKHIVPPDTLTVTQPGEVHSSHLAGEVNCTFCGLHIGSALLQQVATDVAGHAEEMPVFPEPLVTDAQLNALVLNLHEALAAGTASVLGIGSRDSFCA